MQDNLAKERAQERDRIAMELVEVMSQKANSERVGYATGKKMKESIVAAAK